ncbi:zinc finger protein [Crotalus adamanteus]|uniref:Cytoplasmic 60S subunit biogenesis factor ZNF622 n=1 Tax=Crotalus adamanteus TaxID=8729 RepID=A0AAW1BNG6_CROAD
MSDVPPALGAPAPASYTCITCRVTIKDADVQRAHYKTDWHRYNLKRKVAQMPPVTAENFQERVLAQRAGLEEQNKATATYCVACSKRFSNFNAYANHLKSRKHLELEKKAVQAISKKVELLNEKNLEKGLTQENVDKDTMNTAIQQAIKAQPSSSPKKVALSADAIGGSFMEESSSSLQRKEHVERPPRLHWFEQQAKKLTQQPSDDEGKEEDMEEEGWEDIDSNEDIESEEEIEGNPDEAENSEPGNDIEYLVDFRGLIKYLGEKIGIGKICIWCNEKGKSFYTIKAVQAHMNDKSHCKLFIEGDAALEFADFYDFRSSYPDYQEGEDVEMPEQLPSEKKLDYDDETMELILPSGARIGHRSLMRYYKQRFGSSRAVVVCKNKQTVGRVLQQYKALGWTSNSGTALAHERDMQYLQRMKAKWMLKTSMQNNITKQMHFRSQIQF